VHGVCFVKVKAFFAIFINAPKRNRIEIEIELFNKTNLESRTNKIQQPVGSVGHIGRCLPGFFCASFFWGISLPAPRYREELGIRRKWAHEGAHDEGRWR
jgi:hypothetical protein